MRTTNRYAKDRAKLIREPAVNYALHQMGDVSQLVMERDRIAERIDSESEPQMQLFYQEVVERLDREIAAWAKEASTEWERAKTKPKVQKRLNRN